MEATAKTADDMRMLGASLAACLGDGDVVTLVGGLGAGKTQFAQGVGAGLGVKEQLASPTFNLVFEYDSGRIPLRHFDLYRLECAEQLEDIDFYALVDDGTPGASLVEWADMFPDEMPDDVLAIEIRRAKDSKERRAKDVKGGFDDMRDCEGDALAACGDALDGDERVVFAHATGMRSQAILDDWGMRIG